MTQKMSELKTRPRIELPMTSLDRNLEAFSVLGTLLCVSIVAYYWQRLPAVVPTHFGPSGKADAWGPKETLLILPAVSIGMYALLTILSRFPHIFNYPVPITEENAERQYRIAVTMIRLLKTGMVWLFAAIQWSTVQVAIGKANTLTPLVWVFMVGIVLTVVVQLVQAVRAR